MIVADTNIIAYLMIPGDRTETVRNILRVDSDWVAPVLWRSEFRNVLTLYLRHQNLAFRQAVALMQEAENLMSAGEYQVSSTDVLDLVARSTCAAYDCEFVAVAQKFDIPLVTADAKLLSAFPNVAISPENFLLGHHT